MGSAQRKKQQMEQMKLQASLNRTNKKLADLIAEAYSAGQRDATIDATYLFLWALKTREGFGTKRLMRVYEDMVYVSECVNDENTGLTIEDIKQTLLEENKVRFTCN